MTKHYNKTELQERRRQLRNKMTFCEQIVWKHLRKKQLEVRFLRQYSIDNYIIDFYCPELKLAVEIDGSIHDENEQMEYDKNRQEYLENFGVEFIRIKNEELLGNGKMVFEKIEIAIERKKKR